MVLAGRDEDMFITFLAKVECFVNGTLPQPLLLLLCRPTRIIQSTFTGHRFLNHMPHFHTESSINLGACYKVNNRDGHIRDR